jgi:hypothetical protein
MHRGLLARARVGLQGRGRLRSAFIRRAVSDSYYALFHALAGMCADCLVGSTRRRSDAWRRVYRSLDHGQVREELRKPDVVGIHFNIGKIGSDFARLQDARHAADYDPMSDFRRRDDAVPLLIVAEDAISAIEALPADVRLELAAALVAKRRRA